MSRIGSKPIKIPEGVNVDFEKNNKYGGQSAKVKGPLGELRFDFRKKIEFEQKGDEIEITRKSDTKFIRSLHGLYRSILANMIEGVTKGYEKELEIVGIGYRAELKGSDLEIIARATHPHLVKAPEGISFEVNDKVNIKVKGIDKQLVGQIAAYIRSLAKPEPYKGKGIKYKGEYIRRKAGKAAKGTEEGGE